MITPVADARAISDARSLIADAAACDAWLSIEWARSRNFVVVPLPGQELEAIDADQFASAIRRLGVTELLVIHAFFARPPRPISPGQQRFLDKANGSA